jgi:S1-C subfamily serine protease
VRGSFTVLLAHVVSEDVANDLAILQATQNPFRDGLPILIAVNEIQVRSEVGVASLNAERPPEGVPVASSGYPLSNSVLITNAGVIASAWATAPDDRYIADLEVNPGNSGGPVYLVEDGSVIGVCVATQTAPVRWRGEPFSVQGAPLIYSSGLTVVIPSRHVLDLMARVAAPAD